MGEVNDSSHNMVVQCVPTNIFYPSNHKRHRTEPTVPSNWMDSSSYNNDIPLLSVDSSIANNYHYINESHANNNDYSDRKMSGDSIKHQSTTARTTKDVAINENVKTTSSEHRMLKHKRRYCRIVGCTKIVKSQGLCQRHGAVTKKCKVDSCDKQAQGNYKGMCKAHFNAKKITLEPVPFETITCNSNIYPSVTFDAINPDYISPIDNNIYNYPYVVDVNNSNNGNIGMYEEQYCYSSQHQIPSYIHPESSISPALHYSNYQTYGQYYLDGSRYSNKRWCNHHPNHQDVYYRNDSSSFYPYPPQVHCTIAKSDNNSLNYTTPVSVLQRDDDERDDSNHNIVTTHKPSTGRVSNNNNINQNNDHGSSEILNMVVSPDTSMVYSKDHNNNSDRNRNQFQITASESTVYSLLSMPSNCDDFSVANSISYNSI